ncbi:DNA polymerase I [Micrococcus sp. ACRRV]|uniref:DNA polymerase I n=1 Tax=Micrococcus sp. ACRRV TaxID=2918203 RepID=UPI001EF3BD97|nr:DNA polymerase I [Micrococcus sp. ACRRV]MCG7421371.1 DNA polymerase I [Micrococcus sp. ACRRV]
MGENSTEARPRLLVLDGHSMAFRAFYALPAENFATDTGQHTNAVYGFTSMLLTMIRQQAPTHVAVAFDLSGPTFRSAEYGEYKAGRSETPAEFAGQIELTVKVMEALGIPTLTKEDFEADDIVATLSAQAEAQGWDVCVVSGDRDAFQLISERTQVLYPKKGVSDIPPMTAADVEAKYGVRPEQYPELAALVGESADNLPGVPGVGPGFAAKWLQKYGDLDGVLAHADEITGKKGEALRAHLDDVRRNRRLNALVRDLDLDVSLDAMELTMPEREVVEELFDALQFQRIRERVFEVFAERLGSAAPAAPVAEAPAAVLAATADDVHAFVSAHAGTLLGLHVEIDGPDLLPKRKVPVPGTFGTPVGLALAAEDAALYVDLTDADADPGLVAALGDPLAEDGAAKAVHDLKRTLKAIAVPTGPTALPADTSLHGVVDDVALSAYLIQPDRRDTDLATLSQAHLQEPLEAPESAAGAGEQGAFDLDGAQEEAERTARAARAARSAWVVRRLSQAFTPQVLERGAQRLLQEMEIPLARLLARMELAGIAVDGDALSALLADFTDRAEAAKESAWASVAEETGGMKVNLGSPKQLQEVLFEHLDMPKTRKTKTGWSTDVDSLQDLLEQTQHPFLENLMAHRDATKLRQTVEGLRETVAPDGRIHTTYSQTVAATGRLSSLHPNLQNIPVRTEAGRRIREAFVAAPVDGEPAELLSADYSQIEMRIMAHLSEDAGLIEAFNSGEDLHSFVGSQVFGVDPDDVTSEQRSKVKAMSYGLAYGLSSFGLSKQLKISVDEARGLMKGYFDRFGGVRDYLRDVVAQARRDGFTSTIEGRRRYLPDLTSDNRQLRDMAERAALNAPIQGSAADIIKRAMLDVQAGLVEQGLRSRLLLQVHDELILEVPASELDAATALLQERMGRAADLSVPLDVHVGHGGTWHAAAH